MKIYITYHQPQTLTFCPMPGARPKWELAGSMAWESCCRLAPWLAPTLPQRDGLFGPYYPLHGEPPPENWKGLLLPNCQNESLSMIYYGVYISPLFYTIHIHHTIPFMLAIKVSG